MSGRLADLRSSQLDELLTPSSVLILPVGATEQHGPHLPFSTDTVIAEEIAARTVAAVGDELDLWLLPPLAFSKSDEHAWSSGTVWLSATTLLSVLDDIGRSLATLPTKRLVFFNGHGGNTQLLGVANRELRLHHGLMTFLCQPAVPRDSGGGPGDPAELGMGVHGGKEETSLMLHLRPELVDMSLAVRAVPEEMDARKRVTFGGDVPFGWSSKDLSETGAVGDPTLSSAEDGKAIAARMVEGFAGALREIAAFEFPIR